MVCYLALYCIVFYVALRNADSEYIQTQILEARQLYPFRAYKDVQLFHYTVPPQVSQASFHFKANGSIHCNPKPIAVYLQYASYPVMSPLNASFPENFVIKRLYMHTVMLHTDLIPVILNVSNPLPGSWYAAAFIMDSSERIAQKGLFTPCSGWLTTFVKLNISSSITTLLSEANESQEIVGNQLYRFFASNGSWSCEVKLKNCQIDEHTIDKCPVVVRSRPRGLPSSINIGDSSAVNCSSKEGCALKFVPANNDWNYIEVESLVPELLKFEFHLKTEGCESGKFLIDYFNPVNVSSMDFDYVNETGPDFLNETGSSDLLVTLLEKVYSDSYFSSCWPAIPLVRTSMSSNLAFEYNLPACDDDSLPSVLNISNCCPTYATFEVLPAVDIGGTMVLELEILSPPNTSFSDVSVAGCLTYGVRPGNVKEALCESGVLLTVNTSSATSHKTTVLIPFPEAGIWYFTLLPKCYIASNESNSALSVPCESSTTSIGLKIKSAPCISGHCGDYGTCYQYVSGGFIFSTCNCIAGWQGWGCTDGAAAHTDAELLLDVLLLTLSNVLFVPAIIVGCCRRYFTEAFVYFMTMVFSAFYHACDAEVYTYCLIRLNVLQFCDFYSAILSIWVTLVAMADLPTAAQSLIHMAGAIGVALGVEYDRTGLWVIVLPAGVGLLILFSSWVFRCCRMRVCYPKKLVWLTGLLPGTILAVCGLVIYAFFETKSNYPYVHSAWHATIALSVLFLLPRRETKKGKDDDDDDDGRQGTLEPLKTSSYVRVDAASSVEPPTNSACEHLLPADP